MAWSTASCSHLQPATKLIQYSGDPAPGKALLDETKEWEGIYDDEDKRLRAGRAHVLACGRMQHRVVTTQHWMTAVEVWRGGVPVFLHVTDRTRVFACHA